MCSVFLSLEEGPHVNWEVKQEAGQLTSSYLRKAERGEGVWRMKDQEQPSGMARLGEW